MSVRQNSWVSALSPPAQKSNDWRKTRGYIFDINTRKQVYEVPQVDISMLIYAPLHKRNGDHPAIQPCGIGLASTWHNTHRLGCSHQQFSTYKNETSAEKGILAHRPGMLKFHDFALPMVLYGAYLSLHLFEAEFILDGGQYRLKCSLVSTSCCQR